MTAISTTKNSIPKVDKTWLFDPVILLCAGSLILIGLIMVSSASISIADKDFLEPFHYLYRQLFALSIGLLIALVVLFTPMKFWQQIGPYLLVGGILLLVAVLIPGISKEVNGSSRWIPLGMFNLQVSEVVKLCMVVYLAGYLIRQHQTVRESIKGFMIPMFLLALMGALLILEPDLGATVVIALTAMSMLFLGGVKLWQFILLISAMLGVVALLIYFEPYRLQRFYTFLDPWSDPYNTGFQLTQSLIAFGRGEFFGTGLGQSIQKLFYLPEAHTDFLFAILAEELGMIGALVVIALFTVLVLRIFYQARVAEIKGKHYNTFLLYGLGIWIGLQAFINIGVNMGALPTKGLTLPLMSYGGSSLIIMCIAIALVLRAEHELRFDKPLGSKEFRRF